MSVCCIDRLLSLGWPLEYPAAAGSETAATRPRHTADSGPMDWHEVDAQALFSTIREEASPADAERMVWAFEQVLAGARVDPVLLDHLAAAAICALAYRDDTTPREVAGHPGAPDRRRRSLAARVRGAPLGPGTG